MKTIWITGASTGIGEALARNLLKQGHRVLVSARTQEKLQALTNEYEHCIALPLDVTDEAAVAATIDKIEQDYGLIDWLVANAGICEYIDLPSMPVDVFRRTFEVNFFSIVDLTERALPLLNKSNAPRLVYVSSSAQFLPLPRAQAYSSSKAALSHFGEVMAADLANTPIKVCTVHPGFVETPLTDKNDFQMPMRITAEKAADIMAKGITKGRPVINFPRLFIGILKLINALPIRIRRKIIGKISRFQGDF
ncbi:SDR family NAD(P)-dependent oxidoreductase [Salinibius halmophilus]|uniref:SDR family NAD(P)-dependent oxidoreductase n=1 Tax=Salinibius halmophilus TaxID=1853216 RepID=UPI000E673850|nr:SDR family NAD(P)-dependent oxidoreductase [Salinibius halmophilus]